MPIRWKLFRIGCILHMILTGLALLETVFSFFIQANWPAVVKICVFVAILFLVSLGLNLVNQNYPDEPVAGTQKKAYNRLFLVNFLFLSFLFGFVIGEYRQLAEIAELTSRDIGSFPFHVYLALIAYFLLLVFQMITLFGLYALRIELASNFSKRKFDFEKTN
jgi:TRAP-type C4-dicarboxylate transport system permease small subunit